MKYRNVIILSALFGLALQLSPAALAMQETSGKTPQSEDQARGAFLITRKKLGDSDSSKKTAAAAAPKQSQAELSKSKTPARNKSRKPARAGSKPESVNAVAEPPGAEPIGIGYTLYQRNKQGEAVRVNPSTTFYENDSVRFVIEPNIDGYLYIFHAENDADPVMIFPDHRLKEGDNAIKAHVPYEVPARDASVNWFTFDENSAVENLFIVVTRAPLPNIPTGGELAGYCKSIGEECNWKPSRSQFDVVRAKASDPKIVSASRSLGEVQASVESEAISRGIKLKAEAPEPALVHLNVSPSLNVLVMKTQLKHGRRGSI
jgi:hypothetical protein